jgi:DNA-3-methyladenine glycosylase II
MDYADSIHASVLSRFSISNTHQSQNSSMSLIILTPEVILKAEKYLAKKEPLFKPLIKRHSPCRISPHENYFDALCNAIISQQLSVKAARTIHLRFLELFADNQPTPELLLALDKEVLRQVGISYQKAGYLQNVSGFFVQHSSTVVATLQHAPIEEVVETLTQIKGIGKWTAEMFTMFTLGRSDVFSIGDLGLRNAMKSLFGIMDNPAMIEKAEEWSPYRTVASWYLWRSLEND